MSMAVKSAVSRSSLRPAKVSARVQRTSKLVCRADGFIGSAPNLLVCASTALFLSAARFGLAPTMKRQATAGLKLAENNNTAGVLTNDPAGLTAVDVLAYGSIGHAVAIGAYLGLRATGNL